MSLAAGIAWEHQENITWYLYSEVRSCAHRHTRAPLFYLVIYFIGMSEWRQATAPVWGEFLGFCTTYFS